MSDNEFEFGEFQGVQEAPIPDTFTGDAPTAGVADSPPQDDGASVVSFEDDFEETVEPQPEESQGADDFGGEEGDDGGGWPIVPSGLPPVRRQAPPVPSSQGGIPDPSHPVPRPERQARDYDAASQTGARQARTQQVRQGYSQPGQSVEGSEPSGGGGTTGPAQGQQKRARPPLPGMNQAQSGPVGFNGQPIQYGPQGQPYVQGPDGNPILVAANGKQILYGPQGQPYVPGADGKPILVAFNGQPVQFGPQGQHYIPGADGQPILLGVDGNPLQQQAAGGAKPGKKGKAQKQPKPPKPPKGGGDAGPNGGGGKKLPIIPLAIAGVVLLVVLIVVGMKAFGGKKPLEPMVQNYESSGRWALDTLESSLNNYNPEGIDAVVGVEDGDSYLAKEWPYVNNVKIRQEFLQTVGALVKFEYPKVQQQATTGEGMVDDAGNPIMIESYMNGNEEFTVTIPDYDKLAKTMDEKADYILQMLDSAKYSDRDYMWPDELTNLMLQFILDDGPLPTKQVQLQLPVRLNTSGKPYIESDAALDDLLFGSEEFRYMAAKFSQICVGWTGHIEETYLTYEREHNEEYDRWLELFLSYFEADGGIYDPDGDPQFKNVQKAFHRTTSKWEPWYLREPDNPNVIQKYPDGTYIVNYFSVKDENGNDWIQPAAEIEKEVENVRLLDDPWEEETGIWYNWLGVHWLETSYHGKGSIVTRVGDGSREHPAGIGTTIITKVLGTDGMYHDVKVALMGYWTGQNAIDYAEKFSTRNRGFTTASVVQLICFEVYVENLEDEPIEFEASEMTLTDRNSNISSRTGTMYDFSGVVHLEGRDPKGKRKDNQTILNDWATSTELAQKYVCWGKSFGRLFSMVYFDCLAGTGNIPSYSAYKQFTGESLMEPERN